MDDLSSGEFWLVTHIGMTVVVAPAVVIVYLIMAGKVLKRRVPARTLPSFYLLRGFLFLLAWSIFGIVLDKFHMSFDWEDRLDLLAVPSACCSSIFAVIIMMLGLLKMSKFQQLEKDSQEPGEEP